jgi:hypothetical protein
LLDEQPNLISFCFFVQLKKQTFDARRRKIFPSFIEQAEETVALNMLPKNHLLRAIGVVVVLVVVLIPFRFRGSSNEFKERIDMVRR